MFRYTEKKVKTKSDTKWLHIPNYTLHGLHLFTPLSLASSKPSLTCASIYTTFSHLFNSRPTQQKHKHRTLPPKFVSDITLFLIVHVGNADLVRRWAFNFQIAISIFLLIFFFDASATIAWVPTRGSCRCHHSFLHLDLAFLYSNQFTKILSTKHKLLIFLSTIETTKSLQKKK